MKSSELREKFLEFFESKGCKRCPSSSLIPDDPSTLITSAGMVQFKPYFLQQKQLEAPYIGTTTVQKCVRTTDIDIVGTTGRHQSFFEMLGNFSFGAYSKRETCAWAYEFSTEVLGFDPDRLYFTVYLDDDEAAEIWESLGVPQSHITRLGEEDNFWTAGPTGPCGPCSELYFDQGPQFSCGRPDCAPGCDCERYLEYWNCVFTQYDRQEDGTLLPLPKKNIDTGMGVERTAAILQNVQSNYETDILRSLIAVGEKLSGKSYGIDAKADLSMRICADHARAVTFMIADGILPSNEGRGYVLRRLLRRAVLHGQLLSFEPPFLVGYVTKVIELMAGAYPELTENQSMIERIVLAEEERFNHTLHQGLNYLNAHLSSLAGLDRTIPAILSGKTAFELHDRYGFPIDLTTEIAAEQGIELDRTGFEQHMEDQRKRARAAVKEDAWGMIGGVFSEILSEFGPTQFVGYDSHEVEASVLALVVNGERVASVSAGETVQLVVDCTPFYGEMGGQVGDTGLIYDTTTEAVFTVEDTKVFEQAVYAHIGHIDGTIRIGDTVTVSIDTKRRGRIQRNHTATHLLHHALRQVLGEHVRQAGSLVAPDRLRFDFTHFEAVSSQQLRTIEDLVNSLIMEDSLVTSYVTSLDEARDDGVIALFGEKYGDSVRVLKVGQESRELCGGTHVEHTAQIGFLKIISESSIGANLRRIEAVTSNTALRQVNRIEDELRAVAALIKSPPLEVAAKIGVMQARIVELETELKHERIADSANEVRALCDGVVDVGYSLVVGRLDGHDIEGLRNAWDLVRGNLIKQGTGVGVVLGSVTAEGRPLLVAAGTNEAVKAGFDAGAIIKQISSRIQGGGGGKATMAQAGGKDAAGLDAALQAARDLLS